MPVPSRTWFPTSLQEQAAWFQNFEVVFAPLGPSLGFSVAEVAAVQDDELDFRSIAEMQVALDNFASAFRQFRISVTEDPVGTPQPTFPSENFMAPPNGVPAGIFQRLIETVERIRAHPTYTDEMGANLGIKPAASSGPSSLEYETPVLKPEALPGGIVNVKFVRGQSDGISLDIQIDNETEWTSAGKFVKSPAELTIPAKSDGLPRAVRLRARFLNGNNPSGQYSDTTNITSVP